MPFDRPGMLTVDQVYALVAYVLYLNGIVEQTAELNEDNLADVLMPNRDSFAPAAEIDTVVEPSRPTNLGE
jgi:cytochrome c